MEEDQQATDDARNKSKWRAWQLLSDFKFSTLMLNTLISKGAAHLKGLTFYRVFAVKKSKIDRRPK